MICKSILLIKKYSNVHILCKIYILLLSFSAYHIYDFLKSYIDAPAVDETPAIPEKPTEPWSCVHCTFINPPGIHICQVCCKTSYGNKSVAAEEQIEDRPDSRDTDSPLINRDALINSPGVSEIRDAQKVI